MGDQRAVWVRSDESIPWVAKRFFRTPVRDRAWPRSSTRASPWSAAERRSGAPPTARPSSG